MRTRPIVATTIGDPCGIGPEIVVKALAKGIPDADHLLIGDARAVASAVELTKSSFEVRAVGSFEDARFHPGCLTVLDPGTLDASDITVGRLSASCGRATVDWWDIATSLARAKAVDAIVKGPVNSEAIRLSGRVAQGAVQAGRTFLFLITGPLRVVHLTDHIPLRDVFGHITRQSVLDLIRLTDRSLRSWGMTAPRIGVAGINPHAYGEEEKVHIEPAIADARAEGIVVDGPVSPDTLFRLGTEGVYDCIVAHYHDQGHIAVKTWRFEGNCALILGEPFIRVSVAHGTAFDIAGKGSADARSMVSAIETATSLAAGRGFAAAG
ncbi:PdxA family dehydrogenase [Ramlibacter albus]|uniref:4-hydroxythreonine-4-phosphate dehydrogenase PdxA n=1 Tax=Ramlibacter albus TaxID=2079448 RepID=A0A923M371_9BURK|nr:4-hydroxythreonine-4-phosphate dehydrogenase PdxA [Ramlibacter albus]MBC5763036.1 4-hydroxythreonine-4-phosphate dehydrogenase PdxA [Ramlibacter albus]